MLSDPIIQYYELPWGWCPYEYGDGLNAAKRIYRRVRLVDIIYTPVKKEIVLKEWKDGKRVK